MSTRRALAGLVVAAVSVVGCGGEPSATTTPTSDRVGVVDSETGCGPVEHPPIQVASHLVGDADPPSPYTSTPPTSGWHAPEAPGPGQLDEPLRDAEVVAALESGIVVLALSPGADVDDMMVGDLVAQFPDRLLVVPYPTAMPTAVALLTWGGLQRCDVLDRATVTSFVLDQRVAAQH